MPGSTIFFDTGEMLYNCGQPLLGNGFVTLQATKRPPVQVKMKPSKHRRSRTVKKNFEVIRKDMKKRGGHR